MTSLLDITSTATEPLDSAIDDVDEPAERYRAIREVEAHFEHFIKEQLQKTALWMKHERGMTWRQIGEVMGGVTAQRAEQISRGV